MGVMEEVGGTMADERLAATMISRCREVWTRTVLEYHVTTLPLPPLGCEA